MTRSGWLTKRFPHSYNFSAVTRFSFVALLASGLGGWSASSAGAAQQAAAPRKVNVSPTVVLVVVGEKHSPINLDISTDLPCNGEDWSKYTISLQDHGLTPDNTHKTPGTCKVSVPVTLDSSVKAGSYNVVLLDDKGSPLGVGKFSLVERPIKVNVSPPTVPPVNGKLPTFTNLSVSTDPPCVGDWSRYDIMLSGSGLTLGDRKPDVCTITAPVTLDPNAPPGNYDVVLLDENKNPLGAGKFSILDSAAGPIPPGLSPQVDVLWDVMSQKICSDVFGKRVTRRFYCIELKIGNNSGHALQVAGIGFDRNVLGHELKQANASYLSTRAVLQRESYLSGRNLVYHSLQAAGLLMAAFTPFFNRSNPHKNWATLSAIVSGPLLQAFDIAVPDRVPAQLNNLDDESFRDGSVIPNNSQIRTTIFVERKGLSEAVLQAGKSLGLSPDSTAKGKKTFVEQLETGLGLSPGCTAEDKANRTTQTACSAQEESFAPDKQSLFLVRIALGNLVLVGDPIDYLPRVQITSSGTASQGATVKLDHSSLDFDTAGNTNYVAQAGKTPLTVTVTNGGSAPLTSVTASADKKDFQVDSKCGGTQNPGDKCEINVTFKPTAPGKITGTLTIVDSAADSPQHVQLSGTGTASVVATSSPVTAAKDKPASVTLKNSSSSPVTVNSVTSDNAHFTADTSSNCFPEKKLAAGDTCDVKIQNPTGASDSATIVIKDDAGNQLGTFTVKGSASP